MAEFMPPDRNKNNTLIQANQEREPKVNKTTEV